MESLNFDMQRSELETLSQAELETRLQQCPNWPQFQNTESRLIEQVLQERFYDAIDEAKYEKSYKNLNIEQLYKTNEIYFNGHTDLRRIKFMERVNARIAELESQEILNFEPQEHLTLKAHRKEDYKFYYFEKSKVAELLRKQYAEECKWFGRDCVISDELAEIISKVADWLTNRNAALNLLLLGKVGTGKTTLLKAVCAVIETLISLSQQGNQFQSRYVSQMRCVQSKANKLQKVTEEQDKVFIKVMTFWFIDDVGIEPVEANNFGNKSCLFADMVADAYEAQQPLIITANINMSEILKRYGERTADRLRQSSLYIPYNGESYRKPE